ncbi:MAG: ferrochelatase [Candidatus Methylacidiphilales bacterium]
MAEKQAVLLFNLGSPESTSIPDVRAYLKEFLLDPRVIDSPAWLRHLIVRGFILPFRPRKSAEAYREIWTEEGSPLIVISRQQQQLLEKECGLPVYLCMRYGSPSTKEVLTHMVRDGVTDLLVIPMYPHYSMASYETGLVEVQEQIRTQLPDLRYDVVQPFFSHSDYIGCLAESIRPYLKTDTEMLLMSYHGIPERHLRKSDPSHAHCLSCEACCDVPNPAHATCYRHQCLETSRLVRERLDWPVEKFSVSFQSRLGRDPWLQPYTDKTLQYLPSRGVKKLVIACPAFVADCLETLEEIAGEGKETFMDAGGERFEMVPCLNDQPEWIGFLAGRVRAWQRGGGSRPRGAQMRFFYEKVR